MLRVESNGFGVVRNSFVELIGLMISIGPPRILLGPLRIEFDGLIEVCDGFVELTLNNIDLSGPKMLDAT